MKSNFSFFVLSIFLFFLPLICADEEPIVGKWIPIEDLNGYYIKLVAEYVVFDYHYKSKRNLTLDTIIKAEQNVRSINGSGIADYYRLLLAVKDDAQSKWYEATVMDIPEDYIRELISIKRVK
ncbi:hypothetical protein SLEP1_g25866 [Rubroshorea leprosula]|uniref:Cystatin domain-containing protein n=1 Tax=Rubroshorea leprosula TaxID=152421 RepID=A0AAV5JSH0_9ROSI|nr:hypothetical protein SLEP1_g25866 [Rubroshorea leprosula]